MRARIMFSKMDLWWAGSSNFVLHMWTTCRLIFWRSHWSVKCNWTPEIFRPIVVTTEWELSHVCMLSLCLFVFVYLTMKGKKKDVASKIARRGETKTWLNRALTKSMIEEFPIPSTSYLGFWTTIVRVVASLEVKNDPASRICLQTRFPQGKNCLRVDLRHFVLQRTSLYPQKQLFLQRRLCWLATASKTF